MRGDGGRSEQGGPMGQIKGVAVPVQDRGCGKRRQHAGRAGRCEIHRTPANFLPGSGVDAGPSGCGHVLGAKTDAKQGQTCLKTPGDKLEFFGNEGVAVAVCYTYGTAQHNGQVRSKPGLKVAGMQTALPVLDTDMLFLKKLGEDAKILESDVAQGNAVHRTVSLLLAKVYGLAGMRE